MTPTEVLALVDRFIDCYNNDRLHQSLGFVTPAERHDGRHVALLEARRTGMEQARAARAAANGRAHHRGPAVNGAQGPSQRPVPRRSIRKGVMGPCS